MINDKKDLYIMGLLIFNRRRIQMSEAKLEQKIGNKTEYRIVTNRNYIADRYLQFKSTQKKRNFPDFWNTHNIEVWRYIPLESYHVLGYISEKDCPTSIPFEKEHRLINCFYGHEGNIIGGVIPFTKEFPDINNYFEYFNSLRDQYLEKEKAADAAGTTLLNG